MIDIYAIRKRYGKPLKEIIKDFASEGYSCHRTAIMLGINDTTLRNYCTRFDLHKYWKPVEERRPECRGLGLKKQRKFTDKELLGFVRQYPTIRQFAANAPVTAADVYYRFHGGWKDFVRLANETANS